MTDTQNWLARRYIIYKMVTNLWFFGAVWLYFYRIFITDQQVGILDSLAFAIGLLAEVPSGALADKFGRDKLVRLGQALIGGGIFVQAIGGSFVQFVVGQSIMMVGMSLVSGADEALFYERLNFKHSSKDWRKLVARGSQAALIATLVATVGGGWLHTINPRLPWLMTAFAFILSVIIIWPVKETRTKNLRKDAWSEIKDYLTDIRLGFSQFRLPKLRLYVPLVVVVQGLFYATGYGLLRLVLLSRFHFSPLKGSVVVAMCSLLTVGVLGLIHRYAERLSEKHILTWISLSTGLSLLFALGNIGAWGFGVILVLYVGEYIMQPFMSEVLNNHAPETQRATVLSVASFLRSLPYVALAPLIGTLNTHGHLSYFLIAYAGVIGVAAIIYFFSKKRDEQVAIA